MKSSRLFRLFVWGGLLFFAMSCAAKKTTVQTPPPETQAKMERVSVVQKITFTEEENYTRIHVEGSATMAPPFYKLLTDPLRIAIDVPNIDLRGIKEPIKVDNGTVGEVVTTQYDDKGRIEIGLTQVANYNISKEDKNLIIDIEKVKKAAEVKESKREEEVVKEKEERPPGAKELSKAKEIVNFSIESKKDFIAFNIIGDGKIENYNAFKLDAPARLVLDIWGVGTRYPQKSIKSKNPFIKLVRIGKYPDKLRLVFDSVKAQLAPYQINPIENKLIVSIGNVPQPSEPQILLPEKIAESAKAKEAVGKVQVKFPVDFKQMDHKSRIVVTLTGEPRFNSYMLSKNTIAVDIKNAFVPKYLQRGLDTKEFESAVEYVQMQNVKAGKLNDVRVLIRLREEVPFETTKEGKVLFIDIERPKKVQGKIEPGVPVKKEEVPAEAKKEEVKKEEVKKEEVKKEEVKKEEEKPAPEKPLAEPKITEPKVAEKKAPPVEEKAVPQPIVIKREEGEGLPERIYTGRKLSLDFKDADIKNILRLIAEVSNFNVITADDVTGKITMRLVDVPWDQALDVVLQAKGLGKTQVGNVIWVAPRDALKKQEQDMLEQKRAKEKLEDLVDELIPINYGTAKEIMPQVKSILSDRGDVKVDERTNTLIVKDIASRIAKARSLVKSLDTKTPQILIEARIVEASLGFQRELGIKWGFELQKTRGATGWGLGGGIAGSTLGTATREVLDLPGLARAGVPGAIGTSGILEAIFSRGSIQSLDIAVSAHENKGDVRVISSPKIGTLDNKEAYIVQGLRIPYPKLTTEGTVTTDFIDANLSLKVTPHVTSDGNIRLILNVKKDAPDFTNPVLGVPSIDKKEANTEVLVRDGGVAAIAGIYTINKIDADEGIPLLGKIPLLGWLFKREVKEDARDDLLIFISPKISKDHI